MKLKINNYLSESAYWLINEAKEMERQQQDDFAIEFIKWCENKSVFSPSVIHKPTYKKLLEYYIETIKKK